MKKNISKIILAVLLVATIITFFALDFHQYITLSYIKEQQNNFTNFYTNNQLTTIVYFSIIYVAVTALSLPGAAILTLLAGMLFGTLVGILIVSPASTIGATIAFLVSRFLLRDTINNKFSNKVKILNKGIEEEGVFYLFALRLAPVFPFFIVNILMGLTSIKTYKYFIVSMLGMLPGTAVYVYAGTQIGSIESIGDILSLNMIIAFVLLGIFPISTKKVLTFIRRNNA